jgi:hypothetical protein
MSEHVTITIEPGRNLEYKPGSCLLPTFFGRPCRRLDFFTGPHADEATQEEGPHAAAQQCAPEAAGAAATA